MKNFSLLLTICGFLSSIALAAPQANIDQPWASEESMAQENVLETVEIEESRSTDAPGGSMPLDLKIAYGAVVPLAVVSALCWGVHFVVFAKGTMNNPLIGIATIIPSMLLGRSADLLYNAFKGRLFTRETQPTYDKHMGREIGGVVTGVSGLFCLYNFVTQDSIPPIFKSETFEDYWGNSMLGCRIDNNPEALPGYVATIGYLLTESYIQCRQLFLDYKSSKHNYPRQ